MSAAACGRLLGGLALLCHLLLHPAPAGAQSRRLLRLQATLAAQPGPSLGREQAIWALAWDKEVPPTQQDSLATLATRLATQLGDSAGLFAGQVAQARTALAAGQREGARARLLAVLAQARRRGDAQLQVLALVQLGRTYWGTPQHARALLCWQQAWVLAQRLPDPYWRVRTALLQANFTTDYAHCLRWYFRARDLARQADCQAGQAEALSGLGYTYRLLDELPLAERYLSQALAQQRQLGNRPGEKQALHILAELYQQQGRYPSALAAYGRAAQLARTPDDSLVTAAGRSEVYAAQGQAGPARAQARRGLVLARRLGRTDQQAGLETALAELALRQGQHDRALAQGQWAYAHRQRGSGYLLTARTCRVLARAYAASHDYVLAYAFAQRAQVYTDSLASDHLRAQAARVGDEQARAAQQRQQVQGERDQAREQLRRQQQWLAAGLGALLLLGVAGGLLWGQRRRQARRLAALRTQLASDLHDVVGALLLRVSLRTELLGNSPLSADSRSAPQLAALRAESQQALATLRDVVWNLDAGADTVGALIDRLGEHLDQTAEPAGRQPRLTVTGLEAAQLLPSPLRQHLYLLGKEALTNALRHARGATWVQLTLRREGPTLQLTVTDDGQPQAGATSRPGLGLRTMQQRAQAMGGQLTAGPRLDGESGWQVTLRVPFAKTAAPSSRGAAARRVS